MSDESGKEENGLPHTAVELGDSLKKKRRYRSATRNKEVECKVCLRKMRSDTMKRHMRKHRDLYPLDENDIREEIKQRKRQHQNREERKRIVREIAREENAPLECIEDEMDTPADEESLEDELLKGNQEYLNKIELGKQITAIIEKGTVREESLTKHRRDALYLYRKQRAGRGTTLMELRPWQQELLERIATPTEREIIWVQGMRGNEGKSWFQEYLAAFYGHARVVQLDLKMKSSNVLHALTKQPLSSIDMFLFNEPRAKNHEACNYSILESIKDGIAVASKYNNDVVHFKVPNIVVVFSNARPTMKQLSRDRWCVLRIRKGGLNDITNSLWKSQANPPANPNYKWIEKGDGQDDYHEDWPL